MTIYVAMIHFGAFSKQAGIGEFLFGGKTLNDEEGD